MRPSARAEDEGLHDLWAHPVMVASVLLLVLNDHVFKDAFLGQAWTGKLSDVTGMLFFPALLWSVLLLPFARAQPGRAKALRWVASLVTAGVFAAIQLSPAAGDAYAWGLGAIQLPFRTGWALVQSAPLPGLVPVAHTADLTDLWAVPAVLWLPLCFRARESDASETPVEADGLRA